MIMQMGRHMKQMLEVAQKIKGWHMYDDDKLTMNAIRRLERAGMIEVKGNKYCLKEQKKN